MKMPMLFDTREKAKKEAYKFGCEGAHQMGNKWMPCSMQKITIKRVLNLSNFYQLRIIFLPIFASPFIKEVFEGIYFIICYSCKISDGISFGYDKMGMVNLS